MDVKEDSIRDFEPWKRMVEERSGAFLVDFLLCWAADCDPGSWA